MAGQAQEKTDSIKVVELAKVLQEKTTENKKLMEENKKIQKENENLLEIVLLKLRKLIGTRSTIEKQERQVFLLNNQGTKAENRTDPVEEIEVYDGSDTIRGGWVYRLFHKNDYYLKRYKFQNNEKVYLD